MDLSNGNYFFIAKKFEPEKYIQKDDTLSDISQISEVNESALKHVDKLNESSELYKEALGHLSPGTSFKFKDKDISKTCLVNSSSIVVWIFHNFRQPEKSMLKSRLQKNELERISIEISKPFRFCLICNCIEKDQKVTGECHSCNSTL